MDQEEDTLYQAHLPCWSCPSSDAATLYLNNGKPRVQCFSCGDITFNEEIVDDYMAGEIEPNTTPKATTNSSKEEIKDIWTKCKTTALEDRGITKETADRYNVRTLYDKANKRLARVFPFCNPLDNSLTAVKVKNLDKSMYSKGPISKTGLFGQQLFAKGSNKYITITEGEEDAMAAYQMLKDGAYESVVVSVNNGAQSAVTNVEQHYEYINSFENIIICFDKDKPGQQAAKKVAAKFPGKAKIVKMKFKDANDYLKNGKQREFKNDWFNAEKITVKGVYEFGDLWDEMMKEDSFTSFEYPWEELQKKTYGLRTGELTIIKAPPKIGKTEILREIAFDCAMRQGIDCGIVFLEEGLKRIAQGFVSKALDKPVHLPDSPVTEKDQKAAFEEISKKGKLHIFDPASDITVQNLMEKMMYFVQAQNCKIIFLDHISMFAYKAITFDERRFLDSFCADLKEFANKHDVHICAVIHTNDEGKTRGSRAPVQLCNTLISINRDKLNPDEIVANTTKVVVEENRFNGDSGHCLDLYYDKKTGRMVPLDEELQMELLELEEDTDDIDETKEEPVERFVPFKED